MTKTELKITGISLPRWSKTAVDALTTREHIQQTKMQLRKVESLSLSFISGILIILCSIVGCSDTPYTGSVLTTDTVDVDQYMMSPNEEFVCLQNGTDSECLTLIPKDTEKADSINGPIIHIHPEEFIYIFYHKGKEIVRVEEAIDTTNIAETLTETTEDYPPQTGVRSGGTGAAGDDPDNNNNPDDTQQSAPRLRQLQDPPNDDTQQSDPPSQQQTDDQPGGTGTVDDDPDNNNNPDNTQQPRTPPPPQQQNTNQPRGNNNQNSGNGNQNSGNSNQNSGDSEPDSTVSHRTPNAMYHDYHNPKGWSVTIYYPDNYIGPRTESDYGFSISSGNGMKPQLQKPIKNNGVRFHIPAGEGMLYVYVVWSTNPAHWNGDQPARRYLIQARAAGTHRIMVTME